MTYDPQTVPERTIVADFLNDAGQGTAKAHYELATAYSSWVDFYHLGIEKNDAKAFFWYRKAAAQGNAWAQFSLGLMYANGRGIEQDGAQAVVWYRKAADQGNASAQNNLGLMYEYGRGIEQDDVQAVAWYRKAADQGNAIAQNNLGLKCANGRGIEQDDEQAVAWYRKAADQGNADAQDNLGWMYENGRGIEQDDEQAVAWYRKAANQGNDRAQNNLGLMCANGRGIEQDDAQAVAWYRKAANQGNASAQNNLGWRCANGRGIEQDDVQAVAWYRKSADQGNADAQGNLGWMYANGRGIEQDDAQAVAWYRKAAAQGNANAQNNLGWMCANGLGTEQDDVQAVAWYRKAADQGYALAQGNLDYMHQNGRGEEKNEIKPDSDASLPISPFHPEALIQTTSRGDKVRSKTEVIIANLLHQAGIEYRYEADLSDLGFSKGVISKFVLIQSQKFVVWEHLGMIDDSECMNHWAKKLAWYRDNGFESGKALFITTEMVGLGLDVDSLKRVVGQVKQALEAGAAKRLASVKTKQSSAVVGGLISPATKDRASGALVCLDFETSGLKPEDGCRAIDVGAVKVVNGRVTETFASLMNPGVWVPREIINLTKITNEMVQSAPPPSEVMRQLYEFLDGLPIAAHNANFDERFLRSEFAREGLPVSSSFICSMKLARRVTPGLPSYNLSALSDHYNLPFNKNAHRALPDARQVAALLQALEEDLLEQSGLPRISTQFLSKLQEVPIKNVSSFLRNWREA